MTRRTEHPIWGIVRTLIHLGFLLIVLRMFASNFDFTEWRTVGLMLPIVLAREFSPQIKRLLRTLMTEDSRADS